MGMSAHLEGDWDSLSDLGNNVNRQVRLTVPRLWISSEKRQAASAETCEMVDLLNVVRLPSFVEKMVFIL